MRSSYAILLLLLSSLQSFAQAPSNPWLVLGVVGKWQFAGTSTRVEFGTAVGPQTVVERVGSDKTFGSLTLQVGGNHVTFACDEPKTLPDHSNVGCVQPIHLSSATQMAANSGGQSEPWLARLTRMIAPDPERYYTTVSRDVGNLQDAVVARSGSSIDYKPALSALNKGEYRFSVGKLEPGKPPSPIPASTVTVPWDPTKASAPGLPELSPGLYQMHVETPDNESVGDCWILVTTTGNLASKTAAFADVTSKTASWGASVPAASVRAINRAALDELSR